VRPFDFAVIGGGLYGCCIAEHLARRGFAVVLLEREKDLLTRASYANQARLHGGYHYPRNFATAYRSRYNYARFIEDFRPAIVSAFRKVYAIARVQSRVTARQFEAFCASIEAPLRPAGDAVSRLFSARLIERVYEAEECAFDAVVLRRLLEQRLREAGVQVVTGADVAAATAGEASIVLRAASGAEYRAARVINCTYSGLNSISGLPRTRARLKHELTELALVEAPPELAGLSVTVMDGPFFSLVPFPDRGLMSLSHVRYTPHAEWADAEVAGPDALDKRSAYGYMVRDAARYLPVLSGARYCGSLYEVKTVLAANEKDDGRPILWEENPGEARVVSVLGSKIDNIYDVLGTLEERLVEA